MPIEKTFRLLAIGSLLLFVTCICYSVYCGAIHHAVRDKLVEEWLDIAIERRRLAGLDAVTVLITPEEYEMDLAALSAREQSIVFHTEFPNDKSELRNFLLSRATGNYHSIGFWFLFFASGVGVAVGVAWLQGHSIGVSKSKNADVAVDGDAQQN